jgi:hypothetical protein
MEFTFKIEEESSYGKRTLDMNMKGIKSEDAKDIVRYMIGHVNETATGVDLPVEVSHKLQLGPTETEETFKAGPLKKTTTSVGNNILDVKVPQSEETFKPSPYDQMTRFFGESISESMTARRLEQEAKTEGNKIHNDSLAAVIFEAQHQPTRPKQLPKVDELRSSFPISESARIVTKTISKIPLKENQNMVIADVDCIECGHQGDLHIRSGLRFVHCPGKCGTKLFADKTTDTWGEADADGYTYYARHIYRTREEVYNYEQQKLADAKRYSEEEEDFENL